jgi:hypothetical protein
MVLAPRCCPPRPAAASGARGRRQLHRATAYWPARRVSFGLGSSMVTPIERVPGSAAGAMRAMRPATGCATPSTCTCTGMPGARRATSCVPTSAGQFEPGQVDDGQHLLLGAAASRRAPRGAWRRCRRWAPPAPRRAGRCGWCRRGQRGVDGGARGVDRGAELSSAIGEMNCCAASRSLDAWVRSACASVARALSTLALRSARRLVCSARSMRPSVWPAATRLPSATFSASSVPRPWRAPPRWTAPPAGPRTPPPGQPCHRRRTTSRWANSSGTSSLMSLPSLSFFGGATLGSDFAIASLPGRRISARHQGTADTRHHQHGRDAADQPLLLHGSPHPHGHLLVEGGRSVGAG